MNKWLLRGMIFGVAVAGIAWILGMIAIIKVAFMCAFGDLCS